MEATYIAESEDRLRVELEEKGLFLLAVQGGGGLKVGGLRLPGLRRRRKIRTPEFLVFNQELATLLKAGLPLAQSLDILRRRLPNPIFRATLDDIYDKVRSGVSLSDAFEAQHLFPGVYTASLMAGEKSGSLEQVIRRYVQHVKVLSAVRAKVISALIYPVVLIVLALAVVGLIVFLIVPQFSDFYGQFGTGHQLPMSTRILVLVSNSLVGSFGLLATGTALIVGGALMWFRRPVQRKRLHFWILKLPFFGPLTRKLATAQVSRTLATLLQGGIPLVNALDISARSAGNRAISDHLLGVAKQVREGGSLATALAQGQMFPHVAIEMVEVGESTGALSDMLNSVADFYDEQNETNLTRFSNLIEPLLLIVMGAIIAWLVLALYMPLFNISSVMT